MKSYAADAIPAAWIGRDVVLLDDDAKPALAGRLDGYNVVGARVLLVLNVNGMRVEVPCSSARKVAAA